MNKSALLNSLKPSQAYVATTYAALVIGVGGFSLGLWNATMTLSEKGMYLLALLFGLFAVISLQRVQRDRVEGVPVSPSYVNICYAAIAIPLLTICIGLWNANLALSEKGFYFMAFVVSLFAAVTAQKNRRDHLAMESLWDSGGSAPRASSPGEGRE